MKGKRKPGGIRRAKILLEEESTMTACWREARRKAQGAAHQLRLILKT